VQGLVLYAVVILTVTMNYIQDRQTSAVMATFKKMLPAVSGTTRKATGRACARSDPVRSRLLLTTLSPSTPPAIAPALARSNAP